jgi:hypothetical protein
MADHAAWAVAYASQAQADFQTFEKLQTLTYTFLWTGRFTRRGS